MTPEPEPMYLIRRSELNTLYQYSKDQPNVPTIDANVRSRQYSGAQQQAPVIFEGQSRFACPFQNGCEDGDGFCEYPCEKWLDWHDAAIAAQARKGGYAEGAAAERENTLGKLREAFSRIKADDCFGKMNSNKCNSYNDNGECFLCAFDSIVDSLCSEAKK